MEAEDATRRTHLANERTHLAWWRTGLTALAVGLGAGRIIPDFTEGAAWPYQVLGSGYALLGLVFIGYGYRRHEAVDRALAGGGWTPFTTRAAVAITAAGLALGIGTIVVIVFAGA
jgi:putative membrane protein